MLAWMAFLSSWKVWWLVLLMGLSNGEVVPEESWISAEAEAMVEGARSEVGA